LPICCSPNMPKIEHIDHALLVGPAIPGAHEKGPHLAMRACIGGVVGSTTPGCSPLRARDCSPRGCGCGRSRCGRTAGPWRDGTAARPRSEEHTSELQSRENLVCRLLLE